MDSPVLTPTASPSPQKHYGLLTALIALIIIAVIIGGIYLLHSFGYINFGGSSNHVSSDFVWAVQSGDGSTWYETVGGSKTPESHADLPGATIFGIARAQNTTYVLANSNSGTTSDLYSYENGSYVKLYEANAILGGLTVSNDGTLAAFTQNGSAGSNSEIVALALSTEKPTTLSNGFSPVFVSAGGTPSIIYLQGDNVVGQTDNNGTWSAPVDLYTARMAFPLTSHVASDGKNTFAFADPTVHTYQSWEIKSLNPLTASPLNIYGVSQSSAQISFNASDPYVLMFSPAASGATTSPSVSFINLASTTTSGTFTLPTIGSGITFFTLLPSP